MVESILDESAESDVVNMLPQTMREMARVISLASVIKIVGKYGGIRVCVPTAACEGHQLADLIGFSEMDALCRYYQNEEIEIPRCTNVSRVIRNREIKASHNNGESQAALAIRFKLTERGVRKILSRMKQSIR